MQTISLSYIENPSIRLTLKEGTLYNLSNPLFSLEVENCDKVFKYLKNSEYKTQGKLLSDNIFEYPLGKNILLSDPSGNKFLIIENYYPNIGQ